MAIDQHKIKSRDGGHVTIHGMTPRQAIKLHCTECCGWETNPKDCLSTDCPLFPYRGKSLKSQYHE